MRTNGRERGAMLIVVVWILAILSVMAIGISRRVNVELAMTKYSLNKLKARYVAMAGFQYSLAEIFKDGNDQDTRALDNLWQCGTNMEEHESLEEVFKEIPMSAAKEKNSGYFNIGYPLKNAKDGTISFVYGLSDEERKLNLNALTAENLIILKELLIILGQAQTVAEAISQGVLAWRVEPPPSDPLLPMQTPKPAATISAYTLKKRPFDHIEELLLIPEVTPEVFEQIKDFVTVYPKAGPLLFNFGTAPQEILMAAGRSMAGAATNTSLEDADSMAQRIVEYRRGDDGVDATKDDRPLEAERAGLSAKELAIFRTMSQYSTPVSQYLRIEVAGTEQKSGARSFINAVIFRSNLSVVSWNIR